MSALTQADTRRRCEDLLLGGGLGLGRAWLRGGDFGLRLGDRFGLGLGCGRLALRGHLLLLRRVDRRRAISSLVQVAHQAGLVARHCVRVHDVALRGAIENARRLANGLLRVIAWSGVGERARLFDGGTSARANRLVALAMRLVLTPALKRGFRVCQRNLQGRGSGRSASAANSASSYRARSHVSSRGVRVLPSEVWIQSRSVSRKAPGVPVASG